MIKDIKPKKFDAAYALVGGAMSDQGNDTIVYHDGQTPPTEEEITTKLTELTTAWTSREYARSRKVEYDELNQFELISDDTNNGTTTHIDAINAIKAKYPKPE